MPVRGSLFLIIFFVEITSKILHSYSVFFQNWRYLAITGVSENMVYPKKKPLQWGIWWSAIDLIFDYYKVGPPFTIAKLVNTTPTSMLCDTYNYSMHAVYKPRNQTCGGPTKGTLRESHYCVSLLVICRSLTCFARRHKKVRGYHGCYKKQKPSRTATRRISSAETPLLRNMDE